jgi:hypothetical protein
MHWYPNLVLLGWGKMAVEKLKIYKSLGTVQIQTELIEAGGNTLRSEVYKLSNSTWNKKEVLQ